MKKVYDLKVIFSDETQTTTLFNEESIEIALNHARKNYTVLDYSITERNATNEENEILNRYHRLEKELDLL